MAASHSDKPSGLFVELVLRHQHDVVRFVRALGLRGENVDEVLQQTMTKVWEKWEDFDTQREFLPWVMKFAHLEVLKFRQKRSSERLIFSDDVLGAIVAEAEQNRELYDSRLESLRQCLNRLHSCDQELVLAKYGRGLSAAELAQQVSLTTKAIYRKLDRIRSSLTTCLHARMMQIEN